jgi:small conductance mechanosensitive channel
MREQLDGVIQTLQENALSWGKSLLIGALVLVVGWVLSRLAARATKNAMRRAKAQSLAPMASTLARLSVLVTAIVMALDQMGLDVTTVLAGAGVLGLAVGFGAQTLVKDCISGFFMVVEDVLSPGDWVDLDGKFGQVEDVGLRITRLRAFDGTLWHVPNGEVKVVGNRCREWVRAVATVGVAYEADLAEALRVLQAVGDAFAAAHSEQIFDGEPPVAQGVLGLDDSSVALRLVVKLRADQTGPLWPAERELRRRIKEAFDEAGVEIPFPRRVVYHKTEEDDRVRVVVTEAA